MHIVFVTYDYPSAARPFYGAFVRNLIRAIARVGIKCTVINPVSYFHRKYGSLDPILSHDAFISGNPIEVRKPRYLSASYKNLLFLNTEYITHYNFYKTVKKTILNLKQRPDVLYGHFIFPSGAVVATLGAEMNIPSIVAVGEDTEEEFIAKDRLLNSKWDIRKITGVVAVSCINKNRCINELQIPEEIIRVIPNGVDFTLFYQRNRTEMREKYNLPLDKFIIAFTGHFEERKGPNRILEAVRNFDKLGIVFMGSGPLKFTDQKVLFKGMLEHEKVPELLSAADIFVLPTLSEGCCNAILEAMACGLPVISSIGDYNNESLNNEVSIRVDPMNISKLSNAIELLQNNVELRNKMSNEALAHVSKFNVDTRAHRILDWIKNINKNASYAI
jgi:teichuronic acid biosynthesis glycosyltransferase TuaC